MQSETNLSASTKNNEEERLLSHFFDFNEGLKTEYDRDTVVVQHSLIAPPTFECLFPRVVEHFHAIVLELPYNNKIKITLLVFMSSPLPLGHPALMVPLTLLAYLHNMI